MDVVEISRLLTNAGYKVLQIKGGSIILQDPTCIIPPFQNFVDIAWIALGFITAILLFGWAISLIRGATVNMIENMKNLFLLFGSLTMIPAILNFFIDNGAMQCKTMEIKEEEITKILNSKQIEFEKMAEDQYANSADNQDQNIPVNNSVLDSETPGTKSITPAIQDIVESAKPVSYNSLSGDSNSKIGRYGAVRSIKEYGNDVAYNMKDGTIVIRTGRGTRSWKNNNPGNLRYVDFSINAGAIGEAGGFAVFPNYQTGFNAVIKLLKTNVYQSLTIEQARHRWDKSDISIVEKSIDKIVDGTGFSRDTKMSSLTPDQIVKLAKAYESVEGWVEGIEAGSNSK